jgi:hypothetical protein
MKYFTIVFFIVRHEKTGKHDNQIFYVATLKSSQYDNSTTVNFEQRYLLVTSIGLVVTNSVSPSYLSVILNVRLLVR